MENVSPEPPLQHLRNETKRALILTLRLAVTPILANNILHHFTDHSVNHSDRMTLLLDQLVQPLQASSNPLNDAELIILYSACYVHDIGLQWESAGSSNTINDLRLAMPWSDLSEESRRKLLRENHNLISAEMVQRASQGEPIIEMALTDDYEPSRIADLCEAHTINVPSAQYDDLISDIAGIRLGLLSGLLRLADILDESRGRASRPKAALLLLDIISQTHWWRHHYTKDVVINQHDKTVCVWFEFPTANAEEYSRIVPGLQMPEIEMEFGRHLTVFHKNGLGWSVTSKISSKQRSDAHQMPDNVIVAMHKQLDTRRRKEEEEQRRVLSEQLDKMRPHFARRMSELEAQRSSLAPGPYLSALLDIASDLSDLGGRFGAWSMVVGEYERKSSLLVPNERLELGLRAARLLERDGKYDRVVRFLTPIAPIASEAGCDSGVSAEVLELYASCLLEAGHIQQAEDIVGHLVRVNADPALHARMKADLAESRLLEGNLESAMDHARLNEE